MAGAQEGKQKLVSLHLVVVHQQWLRPSGFGGSQAAWVVGAQVKIRQNDASHPLVKTEAARPEIRVARNV